MPKKYDSAYATVKKLLIREFSWLFGIEKEWERAREQHIERKRERERSREREIKRTRDQENERSREREIKGFGVDLGEICDPIID